MPSPSILLSKSVPKIIGAPLSPSHSDVLSRLTSRSEDSRRTWHDEIRAYITRKTSSLSSTSKKTALTEASLQEFNRQNEILEDRKYFTSPYYRGLTDSSLAINRPRPSSLFLDGESHTGSLFSSSTKTSFVYRVQEWSVSCFLAKEKDEEIAISSSSKTKSSQDFHVFTSSLALSPSPLRRKAAEATTARQSASKTEKEMSTDTGDVTTASSNRKKSLRVRVLLPPSGVTVLQPSPPPPTLTEPVSRVAQSQQRLLHIHTLIHAATQVQQAETVPTSQPPKASTDHVPISLTQASTPEKHESDTEAHAPRNVRKYTWADKYRPYALMDFLCNRNKALELQALVTSNAENCGHFIFEGQPGVGKKTMIWALLREAFGEDNVQAREESKKFVLKGEEIRSINVKLKQSSKHVEINVSELKGYEKHVIIELIKEKSGKPTSDSLLCNHDNCRAVILYDADKLPIEALLYIKWVLEWYKACNKIFFCCSDASKIQPLHSLCKLIQLLPPSNEEIVNVLGFIAEKEGIKLPHNLAAKIARSSKHNLRQAIRSFEATWNINSILTEDPEIITGWEDDIANIAKDVIEEQSPKQLYNIRSKLQNFIEHNVSAEFIFEILVKELKKNSDEQLWKQIDNLYEKYNKKDEMGNLFAHRPEEMGKRLQDPCKKAVRQFMRIEEFIAKFMSWYKGLIVKNRETCTHVSLNTS